MRLRPRLALGAAFFCLAISLHLLYARKIRPYRYWALSNPCAEFRLDDPEYKRFRPGCHALLDGGVEYHTNELQLRERPLSALRPRRILFIGNSFVEGLGVPAKDALPARLEARSALFSVINAGMAMSSPTPQRFRALRVGRALQPELILWGISDLDRTIEQFFQAVAVRDSSGEVRRYEFPDRAKGWLFRLATWREHWRGFDFARFFYFSWLRDSLAEGKRGFPYCSVLEAAKASGKDLHAPVVFVALPNHPRLGSAGLDAVLEECAGASPLIDLRGVMGDEDDYQEDLVHFSGAGAEKAAAKISAELARIFPAWGDYK